MDFKVLFDRDHQTISNGTTAYSDILYIPPAKTALLSLYNMVSTLQLKTDPDTGKKVLDSLDYLTILKLSFGQTGDLARRVSCGEVVNITEEMTKLLEQRRIFYEPVYQLGEAWCINPCNNFALIPTPGYYMLEFKNVNQFHTAYVEYALLSVCDSGAIPDVFKLGGRQ